MLLTRTRDLPPVDQTAKVLGLFVPLLDVEIGERNLSRLHTWAHGGQRDSGEITPTDNGFWTGDPVLHAFPSQRLRPPRRSSRLAPAGDRLILSTPIIGCLSLGVSWALLATQSA
ncbi:hypothetical protein KBI5_20690 [Frankia sp. KB5]|nr:hypothetical protein KBI5_20690 [Frankia sp. KB5]